jgi:hypothetical protein
MRTTGLRMAGGLPSLPAGVPVLNVKAKAAQAAQQ